MGMVWRKLLDRGQGIGVALVIHLSVFDSDSSDTPVVEAPWKPAIPRYPQLGRHGTTAEPPLDMARKNPISADLRVTVPGTMRAREYPESRDLYRYQ